MNILVTRLEFGVKKFKAFRKRLVLDYKKGNKHDHKNPHAIPLEIKQKLLNVSHFLSSQRKEVTGRKFESCRDRV